MDTPINFNLSFKHKLLLGYRGNHTLIAFFFLFIGSLLFYHYLLDFDFREFYKLSHNTATCKGKITNTYYTGIHGTIGDDEGHYYINAYTYEYVVNNYTHKWVSYSRSSSKKVGDIVYIKYNLNSPQYSVIKGYKYRPKGTFIANILFIPALALLLLLFHVFKGIRFYLILKNGTITRGKQVKNTLFYSGEYSDIYFVKYTYTHNSNNYNIQKYTTNQLLYNNKAKSYIIHKINHPRKALILNDLPQYIVKHIKSKCL